MNAPPPPPPRRRFLQWLSVALGGVAATVAGAPVIGMLFARPPRPDANTWRPVGAVDDFVIGQTVEVHFANTAPVPWAGPAARTAAWLRRVDADRFIAFAINCTHLGCPVRWTPDAGLFFCPCHGGVYYEDGSVAAGPPPSPLSRYAVRVRGGQVEIEASALPV
jgi:menaquinol-cytochrome c reductase iron-sulfur subunit